MKTINSWLNVIILVFGTVAASSGHWWAAAGMWVFVITDILGDIADAARAAAGDKK